MRVLLLSFMVFSLLIFSSSSSSSPTTGSSKASTMVDDETSSGDDQFFSSQGDESLDSIGMEYNSEVVEEGVGFMEGRMLIQFNDYPGTGANNRHDPKPPTIIID